MRDADDYNEGEMPWEAATREAVEEACSDVRFDEVRGVVYLLTGEDKHFQRYPEGYDNWEDIQSALMEIGDREWFANVPFDGGEAVFSPRTDSYVESAFIEHKFEEFFERVAPPEDGDELASAKELTPPGAGLIIELDTAEINQELVRYLALHPEKMHDLSPHKFEELVADIFRAKGYEVVLTPRSKDGGFDIRAFRKTNTGTLLTLIDCKRYAANRPIGVEIVRGLFGIVKDERASQGIIATTSYFTRGAKSLQGRNQYQLHLADFENIKRWLDECRSAP